MAANPIWIAAYGGPPPAAIGAAKVWVAPGDGSVPSAAASVVVGYGGPVAGASPVWIAGYGGPVAGATPITLVGFGGSGGSGGGATSVWSATDATAGGMTLSNGGLTVTQPNSSVTASVRGTVGKTSGKLYVEFLANSTSGNEKEGFADVTFSPAAGATVGTNGKSCGIDFNINHVSGGFVSNYTSVVTAAASDVISLAIDFSAGSVWYGHNNVWVSSSNPATGSLPIFSFTPATVGALFPCLTLYNLNEQWTLQASDASLKYRPPAGFQAWDGGPVTPVTSVWSASDATANAMTLSNGGLTFVATTSAIWQSIRGTVSQTSGKYYAEFLCNVAPTGPQYGVGLASSSFTPTSYLGSTNYSFGGHFDGTDTIGSSGFTIVSVLGSYTAAVNDVLQIAVDLTAGKIWVGLNNTWPFSGAPATGGNQLANIVAPALGLPMFPAFSNQGAAMGKWTLQSTAASQKYAPPAGFTAWDGGVAPPPTSVWSATDATANGMTLSNGGLTVTSVSGAGYKTVRSTIGKTSGKLYVEFLAVATHSGDTAFGSASSGFDPTSYLGSSNYSIGIFSGGNQLAGFTGNYALTGAQIAVINDVWALAIDFSAGSVWIAQNNVWFNASNPATGSLPISSFTPATVGALFPGLTLSGAPSEVWTLQATAVSQKYAPPSGFTPWG